MTTTFFAFDGPLFHGLPEIITPTIAKRSANVREEVIISVYP